MSDKEILLKENEILEQLLVEMREMLATAERELAEIHAELADDPHEIASIQATLHVADCGVAPIPCLDSFHDALSERNGMELVEMERAKYKKNFNTSKVLK